MNRVYSNKETLCNLNHNWVKFRRLLGHNSIAFWLVEARYANVFSGSNDSNTDCGPVPPFLAPYKG